MISWESRSALALAIQLLGVVVASGQLAHLGAAEVVPLPPLLECLGNRLVIEESADSWDELCEKLNPTFVWGGRDLIVVRDDGDGAPRFLLHRAYRFRTSSGNIQWVLLDTLDGDWDECFGAVMGDNLSVAPPLVAGKPVSDHGCGDYVFVLARHDRHGAVYEVGWQQLMANGTSLAVEERRLYFLRRPSGLWVFLGEGSAEGHFKSGPTETHLYRSTPTVRWNSDPGVSGNVEFLIEGRTLRWTSETDDGSAGAPPPFEEVRYHDAVLNGETRRLEFGAWRSGKTP